MKRYSNIKKRGESGTFIKISIVVFLIALIVFIGFFIYYKINESRNNKNTGSVIVIENPLKGIIFANTLNGTANETAIIEEGVLNFNETYISYLFDALGTSYLHKSSLGYGNPKIEMILGDEVWNYELGDVSRIQKTTSDDPDIRVRMSKEDAVRALLSSDTKQYMKDSVANGKTQIEMIAGKVELFSKGYLDLYKALTGKDANI